MNNPQEPTVTQRYQLLMARQDTLIAALVNALDALGGHRFGCNEYVEKRRAISIPDASRPTFEDLANIRARAKQVEKAAEQFRETASDIVDQVIAQAEESLK